MAIITSEELFEAIDILIKEQIDKIGYDTTVICKITDITKRPLGIYRVSNGSSTFDAYSDRTDYQVGDQVRITIPNGNYDEKKWIEGKYISETEEDLAAASLDATSGAPALTGELVVAKTNTAQIKVNSEKYKQIPLITDLANVKKALTHSNLFNVATLKADFKTAVRDPQNDIETGEYGIELRLVYEDQTSTSYKLSSADMIGDPYYFLISSSQERSFLLEDIDKKIVDIQLYLYENGLFKYADNTLLNELDMSIIVSNISLSFGISIQDKVDNSATIFTLSDDKYGRQQNNSKGKQIGLFWCNKTDSEYTGFSDGIFDISYDEDAYLQKLDEINNEDLAPKDKEIKIKDLQEKNKNRYCIYWYKYNPQATENNDNWIKDLGWERIPLPRKNLGTPQYETPNTVEEKIYYAPYPIMRNNFYYIFADLKEGRIAERFQAVVIYNHTAYRSNILTFTNEQADPNYYVSETLQNFYLAHYKDSQDNFPFYNEWYKLNNKEDLTKRSICVKYSAIDNLDTLITNGSTITWRMPKKNTMLHYAGVPEGIEPIIVEGEDFNDYSWPIPVIEEGEEENKTIKIDYSKLFIQYTINDEYREVLNNNTIRCIIKYDTLSTELEKTFMFSKQGNSGTEYTIITSTEGQVAVLPDSPLKINTRFTNGKGEEVKSATISIVQVPNMNSGYKYDEETQELSRKNNSQSYYCHLKITASLDGKEISTIEPVAYATQNCYLKGPTRVIYDYNGTHPEYSHDPYQLFKMNGTEIEVDMWEISYENVQGAIITPELPIATLDNGYLKPAILYNNNDTTPNLHQFIVIKAIQNKKMIYAQSVYFGIDVYTNTFFNNWSGKVELDSDLFVGAPILMAGSKDAENKFSGIVLGDVEQATSGLSTGLYGFDKGKAVYAFKTDGTAYLGKQGQGRIYFNGDYGYIASSGWYDQDNNIVDDEKGTGLLIDVQEGIIKADSFTLKAGTSGGSNYLYLSNQSQDVEGLGKKLRLAIGNQFGVDETGHLIANSGSIGGITLDEHGLRAGGITYSTDKDSNSPIIAYMKYDKKTKKTEYSEDVSKDLWNNDVYSFDEEVNVYISGKAECFIIKQDVWKDRNIISGDSLDTVSHKYISTFIQLTVRKDEYLIINYRPTQEQTPLVSSKISSFSIDNTGEIVCTGATFKGLIDANVIDASSGIFKELTVGDWQITPTSIYGSDSISASRLIASGDQSCTVRLTSKNKRPIIEYTNADTASAWITVYLDELI